MPTIKPILFVLALLLLIIPVTADSVLVCSRSDGDYEASYISGYYGLKTSSGSYPTVGYYRASGGSSSWVLMETDSFYSVSVMSDEDGNIFYSWDTSDMSPAYFTYKLSNSQVDTVTGHVNWYRKLIDSTNDGETFYVRGDLYIDSYTLYEPPHDFIEFTKNDFGYTESVQINYNQCTDFDDMGYSWNPVEPGFYTHTYLVIETEYGDIYNGGFYPLEYDPVIDSHVPDYVYDSSCWQTYTMPSNVDSYRGRALRTSLIKREDLYAGVYGVWGHYIGTTDSVYETDTCQTYYSDGTYEKPEEEPEEPVDPEPEDPIVEPPIEDPVVPPVEEPIYEPPEPSTGSSNESLNTTFLTGYYGSVDDVFQPLNSSVSGLLSFSVSPVSNLGTAIGGLGTYLDSSLTTALYYIDPISIVLEAVFYAIPDKVEFLFQLSLILTGVLVALRWK